MKRIKILPTIISLILCVGVLTFGIFALAPAKHDLDGSIYVDGTSNPVKLEVFVDSTSKAPVKTYNEVRSGVIINFNEILSGNFLKFNTTGADSLENVPSKKIIIRVTNLSTATQLGAYYLDETLNESSVIKIKDDVYTENKIHKVADAFLPSYTIIDANNSGLNVQTATQDLEIEFKATNFKNGVGKFNYNLYLEEYADDIETIYEKTTSSVIVVPQNEASTVSTLSTITSTFERTTLTQADMYNYEITSELGNIIIPEGITKIANATFDDYCSMQSVVFPSTLLEIEGSYTTDDDGAFSCCCSISEIILPKNIKLIGEGAFAECCGLGYIYLPNSLKTIAKDSFVCCESLNEITIPNSVTTIEENAFILCDGLTRVTIPGSVKKIGQCAFAKCGALETVIIEEGVEEVAEEAFVECTGLKVVKIPQSVTKIGASALANCSTLEEITLPFTGDGTGTNTHLGYIFGIMDESRHPDLPQSLKKVTVLKAIGDNAFNGCVNLKEVVLNYGVTSIGANAFNGCTGLTKMVFPETVTSVGAAPLAGCSSLAELTLPIFKGEALGYMFSTPWTVTYHADYVPPSLKKVVLTKMTTIPKYAFYNCENITSITISECVTEIQDYAFYNCKSLTELNYNAKNAKMKYSYYCDIFYNAGINGDGITVNIGANVESVPLSFLDTRSGSEPKVVDINFATNSKCKSIGNRAFYGIKNITSIDIPDSVTSLGAYAFCGCSSLTNVNIASGVTTINASTFYGCTALTSITLPNRITNIGSSAFYRCSALTSITLPNGITNIGSSAFYNCSSLVNVNIPSGVTAINSSTFSGCSSLTSLTLPNGITNIGSSAFSGCSSLKNLNIPNDLTIVGSKAFENCTSLSSLVLPNSVTSIGERAFNGLQNSVFKIENGLKYIKSTSNIYFAVVGYTDDVSVATINSNTQIMPAYAFENCATLTSITIPSSITVISKYAFDNCTNLATVNMPNTLKDINNHAFYRCSALKSVVVPDSVESIGAYAFGSGSMEEISLPFTGDGTSDVTFLGYIFYGNKTPPTSGPEFPSTLKKVTITTNKFTPYNAFGMGGSLEEISIPFVGDGTSTKPHIGYVFGGNQYYDNPAVLPSTLKKVTITNSNDIYPSAFSGCTYLTSITIEGNVNSIGEGAFSGCSALTSVTLPDSVTSIGNGIFSSCSALTSLTLPNVTTIGTTVLIGCSNLASLTLGQVGEGTPINHLSYLFGGTSYSNANLVPSALKTVKITTKVGNDALRGCTNLTSVEIAYKRVKVWDSVGGRYTEFIETIGTNALTLCSGLTSLIIPYTGNGTSSYTHLSYLFGGTSYTDSSRVPTILRNVTITDSVGSNGFYGCTKLANIIFNGKPGRNHMTSGLPMHQGITVASNAFNTCTGLTIIQIKAGSGFTIYESGTTMNLPTLNSYTQLGTQYTFSGWYTELLGGTLVTQFEATYNTDTTYYSRWTSSTSSGGGTTIK